MRNNREKILLIALLLLSFCVVDFAQDDDEDENFIDPTRPGVSESAEIQKKGVLQIEYGADFDFNSPEFRNRQIAPLGVFFAATKKLRLDLEFETADSQKDRMEMRETGIGDVNLGFKVIARDRPKERLGIAFSYSIKIPTASEEKGLGTGKIDHNLRAIFNRTFGKNDFIVNLSYLNVGREMSDKRASGAQIIFGYNRELTKKFTFVNEIIGNTVDEEQSRGIYYLGALTYRANKRLQFDAGVRPGFGRDATNFNFFFGLTVGADLSRKK